MEKNQSTFNIAGAIAVSLGASIAPTTASSLQLDSFLTRQKSIDYRLYQVAQHSSTQAMYEFPLQGIADLSFDNRQNSSVSRETTEQEKLVGELRRYVFLDENWDGEGAMKPNTSSLSSAVAFSRLIDEHLQMPEPLMNANGLAGLYWKNNVLYAELSFLSDGRIAYFIQRKNDKHKGILDFEKKAMPDLFQVLLAA